MSLLNNFVRKDDEMSTEISKEEISRALQFSNNQKIVKLVLDIGEQLLMCGGEVSRVEETVMRICAAYGAIKTDVFCISSNMIITSIWDNGDIITQTRRVSGLVRDFHKLELLNALSRKICAEKTDIETAREELKNIIKSKKTPFWASFLGSLLIVGTFAVFFGGTPRDAVGAVLSAIPIFLIDRYIYNNKMNSVVYYIICCFIAGAIATATVHLGIGENLDKIMIGCIMLVIPGINLTTAVEDVMSGDTATGTLKMCESIMAACAIACGFAFSVYICGGRELAADSHLEAERWAQILVAALGALGYGLFFGQKRWKLFFTLLGGGVAWLLYLVLLDWIGSVFVSALVVSMVATAYSQVLARVLKAPATVFIFPVIVPLVPGSGLYYTVSNWLLGDTDNILKYAASTVETAIGLALGIVIVIALTKVIMELLNRKNIKA